MKTEPLPSSEHSADTQESPLCLGCLTPNQSSANFCTKCGAPMTSFAASGPFECLFAEGHVYRQAAEKPKNLTVVLGIWLIFGSVGIGGLFIAMMGSGSAVSSIVLGSFLFLISLAIVWKSTRSYLVRTSR